jgi:LAO/AO transport system kinase
MKEDYLKNWIKERKKNTQNLDVDMLASKIQAGDIVALSQGITLLENSTAEAKISSNQLLKLCLPFSGTSIRIGITGVPGVGKSSFIEEFGLFLRQLGKKIAVLAIDPSSEKTKGSILGDKTRMNRLAVTDDVFIRPSASGASLGGVCRATRESILLCEACGFDIILIETVGVGQSETVVHSMTDFFLLLMLAGAGDELQGIKRGIMEMADGIAITKADGENCIKAKIAQREYKNALHLYPQNESKQTVEVITCSSLTNDNIDGVFTMIESYLNATKISGFFDYKRKSQDKFWLHETLKNAVLDQFYQHPTINLALKTAEVNVTEQKESAFGAADELLKLYNSLQK